jgi:hypothetical protein
VQIKQPFVRLNEEKYITENRKIMDTDAREVLLGAERMKEALS